MSRCRLFISRFILTPGILLAVGFLTSCASGYFSLKMPTGTYVNAERAGQSIRIIEGRKLVFNLPAGGYRKLYRFTHSYRVDKNGDISIEGSSNSPEYLWLVTDNKWRWDGKNIIQTTYRFEKTGEDTFKKIFVGESIWTLQSGKK